ncbi:MAG: flagellar basal body rod protein FlgB [Ruminiclostridium sp.]|nr:flagellar basal body rod protein FlgB [Ruminiclostridium sp.]MBQ8411035.1 flagellar basal body rod protein FlgB [Ruminiclostridium sp.]MBQ8841519.1 flagellar basal body rod protein FlgB [Ruminiclostridium sp.]
MALFDYTSFRIMEQGISLLSQQQNIIAHNIANQDTPDYKCKYLYFAGVLKEQMDKNGEATGKKRIELESTIYVDDNTKDQPDGNNVDADTQQALFAKNAIQYEAIINQMNAEFNMMRVAMRRT